MADLRKESCVPCRAGLPLGSAEIGTLWGRLPGWGIASRNGVKRLEKSFTFPDFTRALAFTVKVGRMADRQDHHPEILLEWGKATVSWWTHKVRGLHRNDFICAAKTDALAARVGRPPGKPRRRVDSPAGKR
jgi:4a-hydroxytetrahydrobiopterin dehydratase